MLRLVLANTEELHDRIEHLCSRIRELENALRTLQETVSEDPHPLLRQDLLQVKAPQSSLPSHISAAASSIPTPSPYSTNGHVEPQERTEDENFLDAFGRSVLLLRGVNVINAEQYAGTLTIGLHGESNFLGKTARSEVCVSFGSCLPWLTNHSVSYTRAIETTTHSERGSPATSKTHDAAVVCQ